MSKTISITLADLVNSAQVLGELRETKKPARMAYDIARYIADHVQPALNAYDEAKKGIITTADSSGSLTSDHPEYKAVVSAINELLDSRVELPEFPVALEALVTGMETFDKNAASESVFFGLMKLANGSTAETIH